MKKPDLEKAKKTLKMTDFPLLVIIETVAGCNLECIMCPQKTMKRTKGVMDMKLFEKICKEIAEDGLPNTQLWMTIMGEIFTIGEKALDYITTAQKYKVPEVIINTNAVLMDKNITDKVLESPPDKIYFGIDANTKETYKKIRVKGDFDRMRNNILYLIKRKKELGLKKPELFAQFIVMEENEHEEEDFKKYWLDKGINVKTRQKLGWGTGVEAKNLDIPQTERNMPCPWIMRTVSIHWTGDVTACDADWAGNYYVGNLKNQNLKDIWLGDLKKRRDAHLAGDFSFPTCQECNDWQCGLSEFYYPQND